MHIIYEMLFDNLAQGIDEKALKYRHVWHFMCKGNKHSRRIIELDELFENLK